MIEIIISVFVLGLLGLVVVLFNRKKKIKKELANIKQNNIHLLKENEKLCKENRQLQNNFNNDTQTYYKLLEECRILHEDKSRLSEENSRISKELYFLKGQKSNMRVEVYPYKKMIENKSFFGKNQQVELGYQYRLFINDVPCLSPHIEILETVSVKELDEKKVNSLITQISNFTFPMGSVKFAEDLTQFGKFLLGLNKK